MLIYNAKIHTMEGPVIENGYVLIRDGRIAAAGPSPAPEAAGEELMDAQGGLLLPGFVDAHTHPIPLGFFH